jgi:hypothetical protein
MDIGLSLSFPFQDEEWVRKIAIGAVIVLVGIITFGIVLLPLMGWGLEVMRRLIRDQYPVLPEWQDFGQLFVDGLKLFALSFVWALPIILVSACLGVLGAFSTSGGGEFGQGAQTAIGSVSAIVSTCIGIPYGLAIGILLPAAMGILADSDDFGRALNPANAFRLVRDNIGNYLIAWFIGGLALFVVQIVGTIACGIGLLPALAYGTAVVSHLYGQAYRLSAPAAAAAV